MYTIYMYILYIYIYVFQEATGRIVGDKPISVPQTMDPLLTEGVCVVLHLFGQNRR